jgi:prepilin-type N-terminal cleavage/methylation domain-containing protein
MVRDVDSRMKSESRVAGCRNSARPSGLLSRADAGRGQGGFTLVELMVAIVVLLIGALAAFGTQVTSGQMIDFSRDVTVAVNDLEMCMEELLLQSADNMPIVYPEGAPVPGYAGLHLRNGDLVPTYLNWDAGQPIPDPLEIQLTATWLDGSGRIQRQTLTTAKSR